MPTQKIKFIGIPKIDVSEDGNMPYFQVDAKNFEKLTGCKPGSLDVDPDAPDMFQFYTEELFGHEHAEYQYEITISRKGK